MAQIDSEKEKLEEWFDDKPREFIVTVAARSALRVTPLLVKASSYRFNSPGADFFVPVFRSTASACAYGIAPTHAVLDAATLAASADNYAYITDASHASYAAVKAILAKTSVAYAATVPLTAATAAGEAVAATKGPRDARIAAALAETELWAAVPGDCAALENSAETRVVFESPLWPDDGEPKWSKEHWEDLTDWFDARPEEGWDVWIKWWQARRDGKPYNVEMEREIVLIPDEDWNHKDNPGHINHLIAEIRAKYSKDESDKKSEGKGDILALLRSDPLMAALVDFDFDTTEHLLRVVPFPEDLERFENAQMRKQAEETLGTLRDLTNDLGRIVKSISNAPDAQIVAATLEGYAQEAARGIDKARMPYLRLQGVALNDYRLDPDIYDFMPNAARKSLDRIVDAHLEFIRLCFRDVLVRAEKLSTVGLSDGATKSDLIEQIRNAADAIDAMGDEAALRIEPGFATMLRDLAKQIEQLTERARSLPKDQRNDAEADLENRAKATALSVLRGSLTAKAHAADFAELANVPWKNAVKAIWQLLTGVEGSP